MERPHRSNILESGDSAPRSIANWLDPAPYEALTGIDRAGLMWEWLRRDPKYRTASDKIEPTVLEIRDGFKIIRQPADSCAANWGLHFCRDGRYRHKVCGHHVARRI